jgi:cell division inhibitor SepF
MSALRRLKAYFGMVPAEEFDAADFDPSHGEYGSGYPEPGHGAQGYNNPVDGCKTSFAAQAGHAQAGHPAAPRAHISRPPFWTAQSRGADFRAMEPGAMQPDAVEPRGREALARESWAIETPVRGSLAIDTAAADIGPMLHQPERTAPAPRPGARAEEPLSVPTLTRIVTLHPHNYNEARPIGERYREGNPVIMNLTEMEDRDAKRLVDFAAGLAFALRGSIDKVTSKVFLLSPPNSDVSAEDRRRIAEGCFFN